MQRHNHIQAETEYGTFVLISSAAFVQHSEHACTVQHSLAAGLEPLSPPALQCCCSCVPWGCASGDSAAVQYLPGAATVGAGTLHR